MWQKKSEVNRQQLKMKKKPRKEEKKPTQYTKLSLTRMWLTTSVNRWRFCREERRRVRNSLYRRMAWRCWSPFVRYSWSRQIWFLNSLSSGKTRHGLRNLYILFASASTPSPPLFLLMSPISYNWTLLHDPFPPVLRPVFFCRPDMTFRGWLGDKNQLSIYPFSSGGGIELEQAPKWLHRNHWK